MQTIKNIISIASLLSLLLILFNEQVFAGTTGKISGQIIDVTTGEPLIGANVIIVGTNLGAATSYNFV